MRVPAVAHEKEKYTKHEIRALVILILSISRLMLGVFRETYDDFVAPIHHIAYEMLLNFGRARYVLKEHEKGKQENAVSSSGARRRENAIALVGTTFLCSMPRDSVVRHICCPSSREHT